MPRCFLVLLTLMLIIPGTLQAADAEMASDAQWKQVLNGEHRSAENRKRDADRHPQQTLDFFSVKPTSTVVEIWPGGRGWYTEILAPLLRDKGRLYAAHFNDESKSAYFRKGLASYKAKLAAAPSVYDKVTLTVLDPAKKVAIAPAGSADHVLTFRNVHNWVKAGTDKVVFAAMFNALKPGGILGLVEHRAKPGTSLETMVSSGYVTEEKVKQLASDAGFKFVAGSAVNANPKDTANHPGGVWALPPTLRNGDKNKSQYVAIGESDRMTLKFVKP